MRHAHCFLPLAACAAMLFVAAGTAVAQVPLGGEFRVNSYTTGEQVHQSATATPDGRALVVFNNRQLPAIMARTYDPSGAPGGSELPVSLPGAGGNVPAVAPRPAGFVTVWHDISNDPDGGILARLQDPTGNAVGLPFRVNTYTTGLQFLPRVAADSAGNFVVVWQSYGQDGNGQGVFGRRFNPGGVPIGVEFQVNTYTLGNQYLPALAMTGDGRFVVAWTDQLRVHARRYDAQANPAGPAFAVAPATGTQAEPALAMQPDGGFVVLWDSFDLDAPGTWGVQARLFTASGTARGADFQVNQLTTSHQLVPAVCADADGDFFAVWTSTEQDGDQGGIFARRIDARGTPSGAEFQVNTYTTSDQSLPAIACDPDGNVLIAWPSLGQDGDSYGIYARRLGRFDPDGLEVDAKTGNGVFEPGETVEAATEWRNFTHQGFNPVSGTASAFTGPAGATYTIADAAANYGQVGAGETTTCEIFEDCFAFTVSAPPTRPVTHWDARFLETLNLGRTHTWTLHIGGSFGDVPVTSPFYRFIETVLHNGVTGGCQAASYCPTAATLREQMPVMVLVAREGAGYQPPACQAGAEAFADVPASSPFCRWIEELARRNVVGGCAQNTYCPAAAVSREQMAVFVLATLEAPGYLPPACGSPMFGDVPASSPFCRWIEELARRGVVSGCGNGNYCPTAAVTREQVSVFVAAGFGLTLYGP